MKKYLVTGAAGFIGSNFVKYLLDKYGDDVEITILDALTYAGNLGTIAQECKLPNVHFVRGDIADRELVSGIMAEFDPDYVVNFAAESHVDRSITNPRLFMETNVLGTQNMLDCARKAWVLPGGGYREGKRYLQISTDEVYGSLTRDFDAPEILELDEATRAVTRKRTQPVEVFGEGFFTEETPLSPKSPYSASKASADMLALAYNHTYGMPVCITRCSNNYGPYHFPEKLIPLTINNLLQGRDIPVYGAGLNVRDWLYVADHAKAIDMVLRHGRDGEVYNVGGFNERQNIDIVTDIIDILHELLESNPDYRKLAKVPVDHISRERITYVADRPGHDMRYAIDPTKIVKELGWYPETPFCEGIRMTVKWYLDNPAWTAEVTSGDYMKYYDDMYSSR